MASASIRLEGAEGLLTGERHTDYGAKGYLLTSDNVFVRKPGVIEPRFGLSAAGGTQAGVERMFYDQTHQQVLRAGVTSNLLQAWDGAAWVDLDTTRTYSAVCPSRTFTFLQSSDGLRRITSTNDATEIGYVPPGLDVQLTASGSTGYLQNNTAIAYRVCFGVSNSNNQFFLGAPSGRSVYINSGGTSVNISVTFTVPAGLSTSHFYQIYRSTPSGGVTIDPYDDMQLAYEAYLTSSDLSAQTVTVIDYMPLGQGGAALYTNQGQQTSVKGNFPCEAITGAYGSGSLELFSECLWASNYQPLSNLNLFLMGINTSATTGNNLNGLSAFTFTGTPTSGSTTLGTISATVTPFIHVGMVLSGTGIPAGTTVVSVGATSLVMSAQATSSPGAITVTAGDTLTIAGVTYTAWTSESIANRQFLVSNNASAGIAIRLTAESLIRVVNRATANTFVYMRYQSGPNELPGNIYLYARTDRASSYTIVSTAGAAFSPYLGTATTIPSIGVPGRIVYSKPGEPEAWPPDQFFDVPGNATVIGLKALQSALLVFTDRGVYRMTGVYGNFAMELIDASTILATTSTLPGTGVVVVNNIAFALATKGLVAITESSARRVEHCPDSLINPEVTANQISAHLGDSTVFIPTSFGTYVYHADQGIWLAWATVYSSGVYDQSTGIMYLHADTQSYASRNSQYTAASYYDSDAAVTINSIDTTNLTVTLASAPSSWVKGDLLIQGSYTYVITNIASNVATLTSVTGLTAAAATVRIGFTSSVTYCPVEVSSGSQTQMTALEVLFDGADMSPTSMSSFNNTGYLKLVDVGFATDQDQAVVTSSDQVSSGDYPFILRVWPPASARRGNNVTISVSWRTCANKTRFIGVVIERQDSKPTRNRQA